jgi:hypothetical protein
MLSCSQGVDVWVEESDGFRLGREHEHEHEHQHEHEARKMNGVEGAR